MDEEPKRGPRGRVGDGNPGRNFRRRIRTILAMHEFPVRARSAARLSEEGRAWLARKAGR